MTTSTTRRSHHASSARRRRIGVVAAVLLVVPLIAALLAIVPSSDSDDADDQSGRDANTERPTVSLPIDPEPGTAYAYEGTFAPLDIEALAGDTVRFENLDDVAHTYTDDRGLFDSGPIEPGARYGFAYPAPGRYSFHCEIHPTMRGQVTITPID